MLKSGKTAEELYFEFILRAKLLYRLYQTNIIGFAEVQKIIIDYYKNPQEVLKRFKIQ